MDYDEADDERTHALNSLKSWRISKNSNEFDERVQISFSKEVLWSSFEKCVFMLLNVGRFPDAEWMLYFQTALF